MAHYAEISTDNIVLRVIVVADEDCADQNGAENEAIGALFCHRLLGGRWIKTSYNSRIRGKYAGIGDTYDAQNDIFVAPTVEAASKASELIGLLPVFEG